MNNSFNHRGLRDMRLSTFGGYFMYLYSLHVFCFFFKDLIVEQVTFQERGGYALLGFSVCALQKEDIGDQAVW